MDQPILDKKKRCPKGHFRNKEGVCVPKAVPKATVKKTSKTNKTRKQTQTTIFAQRKKCIQKFRSKLTSATT